jgi:hypothetical protein
MSACYAMVPLRDACERKRLLTERYHRDRHSYIENVRKIEGVDGAGFEVAYIREERARIAFERSRLKRNEHIAQHGCDDENAE